LYLANKVLLLLLLLLLLLEGYLDCDIPCTYSVQLVYWMLLACSVLWRNNAVSSHWEWECTNVDSSACNKFKRAQTAPQSSRSLYKVRTCCILTNFALFIYLLYIQYYLHGAVQSSTIKYFYRSLGKHICSSIWSLLLHTYCIGYIVYRFRVRIKLYSCLRHNVLTRKDESMVLSINYHKFNYFPVARFYINTRFAF